MSISQFTIDRHKAYDAAICDALTRHNNGESWKDICQSYGFDRNQFATYLENKGIRQKRIKRKIHTDTSLLKIIYDKYLTGNYTISDLAKEYGIYRKTLSKDLKQQYGLEIRQDGRKQINEQYFNEIDTAEKAYWLGFLYADGNNSERYNIELGLQALDVNHIEKFAKALKARQKICYRKCTNSYRISIKSKLLSVALSNHGCISNKTYYMQMPITVNESLMNHFIRGYFDGDGCVCWNKKRAVVSFTTASFQFAQQLSSFLLLQNIETKIYKRKNADNWIINIHRQDAIEKFYHYIYKNAYDEIWLTRKYKKFNAYFQYKYLAV